MTGLWRRAVPDRMLALLAAAMVFLVALAGAGALGASGVARQLQDGAVPTVTIQAPEQEAGAVAALLGPAARRLAAGEVAALLRPWLGDDATHLSISLPAVFVLRGTLPPDAAARLAQAAPGALVTRDPVWQDRFAAFADRLQGGAALGLTAVAGVAAAVIAAAARAALAPCRDAVDILHGLGAPDGMIAGGLAARVMWLGAAGGVLGGLLAVPALLRLAQLGVPVLFPATGPATTLPAPTLSWGVLAGLPPLAAAICWITAQATVRFWLRQLP